MDRGSVAWPQLFLNLSTAHTSFQSFSLPIPDDKPGTPAKVHTAARLASADEPTLARSSASDRRQTFVAVIPTIKVVLLAPGRGAILVQPQLFLLPQAFRERCLDSSPGLLFFALPWLKKTQERTACYL